MNPKNVTEQESVSLKSDTVGDTLCSSNWIRHTLISLCEIQKNGWTEEFEDRLCMLWDLSVDKEVTSHLVLCNFLKIATSILESYDHSRLIEIILGILGNACCNDNEMIDTIADDKELVTQILNHLMSDDTRIVIQVLRILQSASYKIEYDASSKWIAHFTKCESFGDVITFILKSTTNDELLTITMKLLKSICEINVEEEKFLEQLFKIDDLLLALVESFMQLISIETDSYSTVELTFIGHWLRVLNIIIALDSFKFENYKNNATVTKIMDIMYRILRPYEHSYNLFPIRQLDVNVVEESSCLLLNFHSGWENFPARLDYLLLTIMFSIKTAIDRCMHSNTHKEEFDPEDILIKFLTDLNQYWIQSIELSTDEQIVNVLHLCESEPQFHEYLINIVQSDSAIASEISAKVKRAVTVVKKS